jgi:hypothetical protein
MLRDHPDTLPFFKRQYGEKGLAVPMPQNLTPPKNQAELGAVHH